MSEGGGAEDEYIDVPLEVSPLAPEGRRRVVGRSASVVAAALLVLVAAIAVVRSSSSDEPPEDGSPQVTPTSRPSRPEEPTTGDGRSSTSTTPAGASTTTTAAAVTTSTTRPEDVGGGEPGTGGDPLEVDVPATSGPGATVPTTGTTLRPTTTTTRLTVREQAAVDVPTFDRTDTLGLQGEDIPAGSFVEVSCKVFDPTIETASPGGYWYRIASPPWNDRYYAAANTFWNGDRNGGPRENYYDPSVPAC